MYPILARGWQDEYHHSVMARTFARLHLPRFADRRCADYAQFKVRGTGDEAVSVISSPGLVAQHKMGTTTPHSSSIPRMNDYHRELHMRHRRLHSLLWIVVLLISMAGAPPPGAGAKAAPGDEIQLTVQPFFEGRYRPNSWLPFRITVANTGADVQAVVSVQTGSLFQTEIELSRGAQKNVVVYAQAPSGFRRTATVRVLAGSTELKKVDVPVNSIPASTQVIGTLSVQPLTLPKPPNQQNRKFEMLTLNRIDLPDRGEGLSLFDVLLLDGAPLTDLSATQQQALADWVRTGGQLIVGGAKLDLTLEQLPETLRLATMGAPAPAATISLLPELGQAATLAATALVTGEGSRPIATAGGATVGVQREIGKGRVTALGFSLAAPELAQLPAESVFWPQVVRFRSLPPEMMGMQSLDDMQAQQLGFALMTLPVLAIPPLGMLAGLLAAYLLIVGPGLYFLLRRLDRQAWGWVAIPLVTLIFTLGAYTYGLRLRGNDIILNQISVVEPAAGRARVRTYAGLFSPRTDTYTITSPNDALFKPMPTGDFGPGGPQAATTPGHFVQGSSGITDLNVAQWSMNTFAAEQLLDAAPLSAELKLAEGVLSGTVRNTGTALIRDVALFQNMRIAKVGDVQPGESRPVELKLTDAPPLEWGGSLSMLMLRDKWDFNKPVQPPAEVRMQMMVLDALFSTPYDRPTEPMLLGWLDNAPIELNVSGGRIHQQQLALVTGPVNAEFAESSRVKLPRGWIKPTVEASTPGGGPCMTQFGSGWYMDTGILTTTLQLPLEMQSVNLDQATVFVQTEGPPPGATKFDVYDWTTQQWVPQDNGTNAVPLEQPHRFFSPTGVFQMRMDWQAAGMVGKGGGCVSMDVSVEGTAQ